VYTSATAIWDGTSQITGISGGGAVTVGDWVNLGGTYVAQVTVASANAMTLSTTQKYGTAPVAATYTVNDGGQWSSIANIVSVFGSGTAPTSTQVCIQNGTGGLTLGGNVSWGLVGTTLAPVWFRGYNTTVGDLDTGSTTLAYPTIVGAGNQLAVNGAFVTLSGIALTSTRTGGGITFGSGTGPQTVRRCRFTNTGANATAYAVTSQNVAVSFTGCYFTSTSTSTAIVNAGNNNWSFNGCYFAGAAAGTTQVGILTGNVPLAAINCTFYKTGSHGIVMSSVNNQCTITGNTFYKCGADAIHLSASQSVTGTVIISNNEFVLSGTNGAGWDINNASGTNTAVPRIENNCSYNPASGHITGFGDLPEYNSLTEGSAPTVSDTNLALLNNAAGAGSGLAGQWENTTGVDYSDTGSWQRQAGLLATSSGGMTGGCDG
jgi:hypothetical protein